MVAPDDDNFDEEGIGDVSLKTNLRVPTEGAVSASVCELAETAASMSPPRLACSTSQVAKLDVASSVSATRGLSLIAGANGKWCGISLKSGHIDTRGQQCKRHGLNGRANGGASAARGCTLGL